MQRIGRYEVTGELGRGAMGIVYKAVDTAIGRPVAIKTIRLGDLGDEKERVRLRERLIREAQSAGVLAHPNIVTIYDIQEQNSPELGDQAYVFMEFVDGPTLERLIDDGKLPDNRGLIGLLRQTAAALDYAHAKGIVHRDVKPANILIDSAGQAKVADFGVAKIQSQNMTQTGLIMGTPSYMPPEQVQGKPVSGASDQWALAIIVYELLTGERPFAADSLPTLLFRIVQQEPEPPQRLNGSLGDAVEPVLLRALAKDPTARYPNCVEFIGELERALARSRWHPLKAGAAPSMPTMAESNAATKLASESANETLPPAPAVVPAAPAPAASAPAAEAHAARTRPRLDEEPAATAPKRGSKGLVIGAVLLGLALALGAFFQTTMSSDPKPAGPAPTGPAVAGPSAAPADKPSPVEGRQPLPAPPPAGSATTSAAASHPAPAANHPAVPPGQPSAPPAPGGKGGSVQLVTSPPGAAMVLDNDPARSCTSPCTLEPGAGRHVLRATLEGYRQAQRVFTLPGESEVLVSLEPLSGRLGVNSDPPGATVTINGKVQDKKTPFFVTLPVGKYVIEVSKEGYAKDVGELELKDGDVKTLTSKLQQ